MSNKITYIIALKDKFSRHSKAISASLDKISRKAVDTGKSLSLKMTAPIGLLGGLALKSASNLETMETAFLGILGSADKAKKMVAGLNEFTAKTPFQLAEVSKAAKGFLGAGVAADDVQKKLKTAGDIAAAASIPLGDMSAIYAKTMNLGKAQAQELNQMAERGIPILRVLSEQLGKSKAEIYDMASRSLITSDIIEKAFTKMTSSGGFAHKAMINQSKTLAGVYSTMKDNIGLAGAEIGKVLLPYAKKLALKIISIAQAIKKWVKENPKLAKIAVIIGGILAVLGPFLIIIGKIAIGIKAVSVLFSPWALAIGLVIAAITALILKWKSLKKWFASTWIGKGVIAGFNWMGDKIAWLVEKIEWLGKKWRKAKEWFSDTWVGKILGAGGKGGFSLNETKVGESPKPEQQRQSASANFNGNLKIGLDKGLKTEKAQFSTAGRGMNAKMNVGGY
jgi:tape measure domain-containing protein